MTEWEKQVTCFHQYWIPLPELNQCIFFMFRNGRQCKRFTISHVRAPFVKFYIKSWTDKIDNHFHECPVLFSLKFYLAFIGNTLSICEFSRDHSTKFFWRKLCLRLEYINKSFLDPQNSLLTFYWLCDFIFHNITSLTRQSW